MRVLVTGGAGFIGSHLVDRLIEEGLEVTVLDNLATGRAENLSRHMRSSSLRFVETDVRERAGIEKHFMGCEWVFHLAALADIVPSVAEPLAYFETNVRGTVNVLDASANTGVRRFIYAASSTCYGVPDKFPTAEGAEIRCEYPYALTKYLGEQCALHWEKVYSLPAVSLRFFNVYGPRARTSSAYGAVFGVFLAQRENGKPLTVVGDGRQTRDFTYVSDAVDALMEAARSPLCGDALNVGSGGTYSILELAERLGGEKVFVPKRPGEPDCTFADISRIRERLGWKPKVTFGEGVTRMLECGPEWRNAPVWTPETIERATAQWFRYLGARA